MFTQLQTDGEGGKRQWNPETYKQINNNVGDFKLKLRFSLSLSLGRCKQYNIYNQQQLHSGGVAR